MYARCLQWARQVRFGTFALLLLSVYPISLQAQQDDTPPAVEPTRADQIQSERASKAMTLRPEQPSPEVQRFVRIEKLVKRLLQHGEPHIELGGLPTGSGFASGLAYQWSSPEDRLVADMDAIGSIHGYYRVSAGLKTPRMAGRHLSLGIEASHSDYRNLDYYGPGPDSSLGGRTNYRKEETVGDLKLQWSALRDHIVMGLDGAELLVNVGPGTHEDIGQTARRYTPLQTPGLDVQSNFLRAGYLVDFDFRDSRGDPHRGVLLALGYQHYSDLKRDQYSFNEMSADAQAYVPYFNDKRVIALRAKTILTDPERNNVVPFYLQPVLSDEGDFRGFRPYRFQDNNLILFNAEYRWEISTGFDMAIFGDSGRVFDHASRISLAHLQNSAGFGFRFKTRDSVVMRIDTGFSREGVQIWVKFGNVY